jgi:hypothetical protein
MPVIAILEAMRVVIDAITAGIRFITGQSVGTGISANPMNDRYAGGMRGNVQLGTGGGMTTVTNVSIGTQKVDTVVTNSVKRTTPQTRGR